MITTPVLAPVGGRAVPLQDVSDPVFSQGMVGYGAAIDPPRGVVDAVAPVSGFAQEQKAKSKIVSVGVFKNGLALVQQEIDVPGAGTYRLEAAPNPVHGTFWIKSNCQVETALKLVEFETPQKLTGKRRGRYPADSLSAPPVYRGS